VPEPPTSFFAKAAINEAPGWTVTSPVTTTWPALTAQTPVTDTELYVPPGRGSGEAEVPAQVADEGAADETDATPTRPIGTDNRVVATVKVAYRYDRRLRVVPTASRFTLLNPARTSEINTPPPIFG
jgi:hypothetical protein